MKILEIPYSIFSYVNKKELRCMRCVVFAREYHRALCNLEWKDRFSNVLVRHLLIVKSDHTLVLIQLEGVENVPRHKDFKFQAAWLTHPGFKEVVSGAWDKNMNFADNVSKMASTLRMWNRNVFGNIYKRNGSYGHD